MRQRFIGLRHKSRFSVVGFTLVELSVVLFVGAILAVATIRQKTNDLYDARAVAQGKSLAIVANGANRYIASESGLCKATPTAAGFADPLRPTIAELKAANYLLSNQNGGDLYGGQMQIVLSQNMTGSTCTSVTGYLYITGNLVDANNQLNPPSMVGSAMLAIGSESATSTLAAPNDLYGLGNNWSAVGANPRPGVVGVLAVRLGTGSALSAAAGPMEVNAQTGTSYTTTAGDAGKILTFNNPSSVTVTLSNLPDGATGIIEQLGLGQITLQNGTLTVRHVANLNKIAGQWGRVYYRVIGTDILFSGDMS